MTQIELIKELWKVAEGLCDYDLKAEVRRVLELNHPVESCQCDEGDLAVDLSRDGLMEKAAALMRIPDAPSDAPMRVDPLNSAKFNEDGFVAVLMTCGKNSDAINNHADAIEQLSNDIRTVSKVRLMEIGDLRSDIDALQIQAESTKRMDLQLHGDSLKNALKAEREKREKLADELERHRHLDLIGKINAFEERMSNNDQVWSATMSRIEMIESRLAGEGEVPDELREALAEYAHITWAKINKALIAKCEYDAENLKWYLPEKEINRRQNLAEAHYLTLSEEDKDKDRVEADKILAEIRRMRGE